MCRDEALAAKLETTMNWVLWASLALLIVDGFPAGAALLREFGARPTGIVIALFGGWHLFKRLLESGRRLTIHRQDYAGLLIILLVIPLTNVPIAIYASPVSVDELLVTWIKQYLMLVFAYLSYLIWRMILAEKSSIDVARIAVIASIPALAMFYVELLSPHNVLMALAEPLRFKEDTRPSGIATEPSVFAAWALVIWPLVLPLMGADFRRHHRMLAGLFLLALIAGIYLCNARTAAGIGVIQMLFYFLWILRRKRIGVLTALGVLLALVASPLLALKLMTLTNLESNLSNIGRIGSTIAGILVSADHPVMGIGVGQFKYFLSSYAPDFTYASEEISAWSDGTSTFRASTFNLFVRLASEFGVLAGGLASALLIAPLVRTLRTAEDNLTLCLGLSAVGGAGFWLLQDQYAYQPAIFALALLNVARSRPVVTHS